MVGLSIVLESNQNQKGISKKNVQVISKSTMIKPSSPSSPSPTLSWNLPAAGFLDHCSLCTRKLLPGKDIYMYQGDRAFCSVECRCRQILMDEEESNNIRSSKFYYRKDSCAFAALKPQPSSSPSSSSSSSSPASSSSSSRSRKGAKNRANGFAYG